MLTNGSTIDLYHFVLTVDLWDKEGLNKLNLVKHAQVSPSISTATTTAYPPTISYASPTHAMPQPYDPATIPGYQGASNTQSSTNYGYSSTSNGTNGQARMYGDRYGDNQYNGQSYGATQNGYAMQPPNSYGIPPISSFQTSTSMPSPYGQPRPARYSQEDINSPQTTGMFTRNLIGTTWTTAFLLKDEKKMPGIWFVLQDLSVRTEDWFRLKAEFINLGKAGNLCMLGNGQAAATGPTKNTAPVLATVFSKPFQVFSAKKFPGVIESTELSKEFARQGIKIPIRKENGKARRASDNEDDYDGDD